MFNWKDREYVNVRKRVFKNLDTNEILNMEIQDDPDNIIEESDTPLTAYCLNLAQHELVEDMNNTYNEVVTEINENLDKIEEKQRNISNYSMEEQKIGTWIDGKPLYRKVFKLEVLNVSISTNVTSLSIDTLTSLKSFYNYVDANLIYKRPPYFSSSNDYFAIFYRQNIIETRLGCVKSDGNILIILEYTKTTD